MMLLALLACAEPPKGATFGDDELVAEMAGYETWAQPAGWEGLARTCEGSHGEWVRIYANEIAAADLAANDPYLSEGALLVSASYQDAEGTAKLLGAMRKVPGFAPRGGNWYWGQFDDDGALVLGGSIEACVRCHAAGQDHVRSRGEAADTGCSPGAFEE